MKSIDSTNFFSGLLGLKLVFCVVISNTFRIHRWKVEHTLYFSTQNEDNGGKC